MSNARNLARLKPDSGGRLPASNSIVGSLVQQQTGVGAAEVFLGTTTAVWYDTVQVSISPKMASSQIVVEAIIAIDRAGGNYPAIAARIHAYKNGVSQGVVVQQDYHEYQGNNTDHHIGKHPITGWHSQNLTAGDVWTYYLQCANQSGSTPSGTYDGWAGRYGDPTLIVREIAA